MADPFVTSSESGEITAEELAVAGDRERVRYPHLRRLPGDEPLAGDS